MALRVTLARAAAGIAVLCVLAQAAAMALMVSTPQGWDAWLATLLGYPTVGAVIVAQQPRNTIGWLLVTFGGLANLGFFSAAVVFATLDADPARWQQALAWLTNVFFIGAFESLILTLAYLFPTGRTLSRGWRTAGSVVGVLFLVSLAIPSLTPGPLGGYFEDTPELTNPFGIALIGTFSDRAGFLAVPAGLVVVLVSIAAIVARVRRARGVERLQLQWLALALSLVGVTLLASRLLMPVLPAWQTSVAESIMFLSATLGIPIAIGIAILRYRLYDIERIVNRGLVYVALTLALVLVYLGAVLVLGSVLRSLSGTSSGFVTAVSTLIAVAFFAPLRSMIQRFVDRRFYRRRYDAARMIEGFSARLRDEVDLNVLSADLQAIVRESMQPAHVSLWLRPTPGGKR